MSPVVWFIVCWLLIALPIYIWGGYKGCLLSLCAGALLTLVALVVA